MLKGLQVLPGVIDADYTGEIKVMVQTTQNIDQIIPDSHIAQLVILPLTEIGKIYK